MSWYEWSTVLKGMGYTLKALKIDIGLNTYTPWTRKRGGASASGNFAIGRRDGFVPWQSERRCSRHWQWFCGSRGCGLTGDWGGAELWCGSRHTVDQRDAAGVRHGGRDPSHTDTPTHTYLVLLASFSANPSVTKVELWDDAVTTLVEGRGVGIEEVRRVLLTVDTRVDRRGAELVKGRGVTEV